MTHDELKALAEAAGLKLLMDNHAGLCFKDQHGVVMCSGDAIFPYIAERLVKRVWDQLGLDYSVDSGHPDLSVVMFSNEPTNPRRAQSVVERGFADEWVDLTCIAAGKALGVIE